MSAADRARPTTSHDFLPPWRLRHPHVQSIYPSLPLRRPGVERRATVLRQVSRELLVDCGDGVRLLALAARQADAGRPPASRVAVLLHGWEGSANSLYLLSLGQHLFDAGYDVVRLNLRDHGDSQHLNAELFHSCRIAEVVGAVRELQRLHPGQRLSLAGFSLGGNFSLRVGVRAADAGIDIAHIVAVCPVLDPEHTLTRLESGWALYREYFVWKWRRSLRRKREAWPDVYHSLEDIIELGNLTEMTHRLACGYGGFPSMPEYLRGYAVVGKVLEPLEGLRETRVRIIAADDDPIIPAADLARIARPPTLEVTHTRYGGHCGYYDGAAGATWVEREILATFARD
ncbi:MAG: alpha/beta fold hydrolase [Gammaproteobacteria bacterium]|nr:alpha/beta fold hydrolase [Gammaproteobacteria bacterium]